VEDEVRDDTVPKTRLERGAEVTTAFDGIQRL
jgi:hypothetical protein